MDIEDIYYKKYNGYRRYILQKIFKIQTYSVNKK